MQPKASQAALLFAALMLGACSEAAPNVVYHHDQCHRLNLIDEDKGIEIIGAEDIVRLPDGDLLVSAYDRRSHTADGTPPQGGIYRVPKTALKETSVTLPSLIDTLPGGLRPHGIDAIELEDETLKVVFVNRGYSDEGVFTPSIVSFHLDGDDVSPPEILSDTLFCRANDVAFHHTVAFQETLAITLDRKYCNGFNALWENISGRRQGSILIKQKNDISIMADNLSFANGIDVQYIERPLGENNFMAVAETRANRIRYFPKTSERDIVVLPGSPDNITVGRPGLILATLHPSLIRLALYRYKWPGFSKAPSRVVKVTGDQVLMLFDDPDGHLFSAASVAVQTAGKLVIGSVGDKGLLVCGVRQTS